MIENSSAKILTEGDQELELALWLEIADSGDIYTLEILTKHFAPEIYRLFLALIDPGEGKGTLHEQAFDYTEKVFQHAVQNLDSFQGYESVRNWLISIAINIFNSKRILKFRPSSSNQNSYQETLTKPTITKLSNQEETIIEIYTKTSSYFRIAILLRFAHKLPVNRIAKILKMRIPELIKTIKIFRSQVEGALDSVQLLTRPAENVHQKYLPLMELSLDGLLSDDPVGSKQLSEHLLNCTSCLMHHQHLSGLEAVISRALRIKWPEETFSAADQEDILKNFKNHPPNKKRLITKRKINRESLLLGTLLFVVLLFGYYLTKKELPKTNPLIYPTLSIQSTSLKTPKSTSAGITDHSNQIKPTPTVITNTEPQRVISGYSAITNLNRKYVYYREPTLSAKGDLLVFSASITNITSEGPKFENGLFILNLDEDHSVSPIVVQDNSIADIWSFTPAISSDGRYVIYQNIAKGLHPKELKNCIDRADPFSCSDIFLYDRKTQSIERVVNQTNVNSSSGSRIFPSISSDSNWVSFWSSFKVEEVGELSTCDNNAEISGCWNIILLDISSGERIVLPVGRKTTEYHTGDFEKLSISENGDLLAFTLHIEDDIAEQLDMKNQKEAFIFDRRTGDFHNINISSFGIEGNGLSTHPVLSPNGQYVVFASTADNIVTGDTNLSTDIFVRDLKEGRINRINVSHNGEEANDESGVYFHTKETWKDLISISSDGRYIGFVSSAQNLDSSKPANCPENSWFPCTNIYLHDRDSSQTDMISTQTQRRDRIFIHPSLSATGEKAAFVMSDVDCYQAPQCTHIFLYDNLNDTTRNLTDFGFNTIRAHAYGTDLTTIRDENMSGVTDLEFSPDDSLLASSSNDKTIRIWSAYGDTLLKSHNEHKQLISDISFSPDGKTLASSSYDGTTLIWDLETSGIINLNANIGSVLSLDYSPDGTKLFAGGSNTSLIWDLENVPPDIVIKRKHPGIRVNSLGYSPDGEFIALGTSDNTIWILNAETGDIVSRLGGHEGDILAIEYSPDGSFLASGSTDSTVRLWKLSENPTSGKYFDPLISIQFQDWIYDITFSPDGKYIAVSSFGSEITFWELPSGAQANIPLGRSWLQPLCIDFSPQTSRMKLAIGSSGGRIELWSIPPIR